MSTLPRRSPRLAEKAAAAAAVSVPVAPVTPVEPAAPPPQPKRVPKPAPASMTTVAKPKWYTTDTQLRKALLVEAKTLRYLLGQARSQEDFAACSTMADKLWRVAISKLQWMGADEMFLSDICHWCGWGKNKLLGRPEHSYAIDAAKSYIKCLEERIDDPYCKYDEDTA